jgi:hypothetical protein
LRGEGEYRATADADAAAGGSAWLHQQEVAFQIPHGLRRRLGVITRDWLSALARRAAAGQQRREGQDTENRTPPRCWSARHGCPEGTDE